MPIIYSVKLSLKKLLPREFILATHKLRAILAAFYYGFPAEKLRIIGVAGTKGKTTTANLVTRILERAGHKVAMFSTANMRMAGVESLNTVKLTTPSPFFLQKFLAEAVNKKCDYAVIEVSSHALKQHRLYGIDFKKVVITNLMPDHLDYHKGVAEYRDIHLKMIGDKTETVITNGDDGEISNFKFQISKQFQNPNFKTLSFGFGENNDLRCRNIELGENGTRFIAVFKDKNLGEFALKIPGKFNIYNALAAIALGVSEVIDPGVINKAVAGVSGVPGRLEKIYVGEKQDFQVIVDYAHSPDSLKNVYEAVKPYARGRLIAVLGGTGDRDKTYRAKAGLLADQFADIVIVTNEDPYSENPEDIMDQVLSGIKNKKMNSPDETISPEAEFPQSGISRGKNLLRILDRREAIKKAVDLAKKDDIIIITGKGSEQFMAWGDKMIPWDDREVVREALKERFEV